MEKIKQFIESDRGKDIFTVIIVLLVGLSSFGLGRLSKSSENTGLKVLYPGLPASTLQADFSSENPIQIQANKSIMQEKVPTVPISVGKSFFASKRGHKYYSIGCSAGKTIKQENRVYFSTSTEAEKAGYELSSSCK